MKGGNHKDPMMIDMEVVVITKINMEVQLDISIMMLMITRNNKTIKVKKK